MCHRPWTDVGVRGGGTGATHFLRIPIKVLSLEPSLVCSPSPGAGVASGAIAAAGVATAGDSDEAIVQRLMCSSSAVLSSASSAPAAGVGTWGFEAWVGRFRCAKGVVSSWSKLAVGKNMFRTKSPDQETGVNFACLLQERSDAGFKTPRVVNLQAEQANAWAATPPTPIRRCASKASR